MRPDIKSRPEAEQGRTVVRQQFSVVPWPRAAQDNFMLHMQHKVVLRLVGRSSGSCGMNPVESRGA
jgi:hypothetical protein